MKEEMEGLVRYEERRKEKESGRKGDLRELDWKMERKAEGGQKEMIDN